MNATAGGAAERSPQIVRLPRGAPLFVEGEPSRDAYLILSGLVEVVRSREGDAGTVRIALLGRGQLVGEIGALDGGPRTATAQAVSDVVVSVIDHRELHARVRRVHAADPVIGRVLGIALSRLRGASGPNRAQPESRLGRDTRFGHDTFSLLIDTGALREAISAARIVPHYQPIVELATGAVTGFEVLARWPDPSREDGVLANPSHFIPIAEGAGLIGPLTVSLCEQVRRDIDVLLAAHPGAHCCVNVSALLLGSTEEMNAVLEALGSGQRPGAFWVEVTESVALAEPRRSAAVLDALAGAGVRLALDDFGTGYAGFASLLALGVDRFRAIKVDGGFVRGAGVDPGKGAVVHTVAAFARTVGLECIAEQIESPEDARTAHAAGCTHGQGYWFGRPMPLAQASAWRPRAAPAEPTGAV